MEFLSVVSRIKDHAEKGKHWIAIDSSAQKRQYMSLIVFVSGGKSTYDRNSNNGCERMGTMTNRILVFVVRFPKDDANVSKQSVSVCVLSSLSRRDGLEEHRGADEDNFPLTILGKSGIGGVSRSTLHASKTKC